MTTPIRSKPATLRSVLALAASIVPWRRVTIFIAKPEREVARLDVAAGPLVPGAGTKRPLESHWSQKEGLGPAQLETLFRLLTPDPTLRPWDSVRRAGRARLYTFSSAFSDRLIEIHLAADRIHEAEPEVKGRGPKEARSSRILAPYTTIAEGWLRAAPWLFGMQVSGVETILVSLVGSAKTAESIGEPLRAWYGPARRTVKVGIRRRPNGERVIERG